MPEWLQSKDFPLSSVILCLKQNQEGDLINLKTPEPVHGPSAFFTQD